MANFGLPAFTSGFGRSLEGAGDALEKMAEAEARRQQMAFSQQLQLWRAAQGDIVGSPETGYTRITPGSSPTSPRMQWGAPPRIESLTRGQPKPSWHFDPETGQMVGVNPLTGEVTRAGEVRQKAPKPSELAAAEKRAEAQRVRDFVTAYRQANPHAQLHQLYEATRMAGLNPELVIGKETPTVLGREAETKRVDDALIAWKRGTATPDQLALIQGKQAMAEIAPEARARAFAKYAPPISVMDNATGDVTFMTRDALNAAAANPALAGRYSTPTLAQAQRKAYVTGQDIKWAIGQVRTDVQTMPPFNPVQRAQLASALRSEDARVTLLGTTIPGAGALGGVWSSVMFNSLDPRQQKFVLDLLNLHESAMALRTVLGAGQGANMLRQAFLSALPSVLTSGNPGAMMRQLALSEATVDNLMRAVPRNIQQTPGLQAPAAHDRLGIR